ncbi:hypothetical protein MKW92_039577 [Papaver armeniacum]|nr:hypothetical protein MKW92_039577 [Papaver armeniacum]
MGGKGVRRREKNYNKAHGEKYKRLPPPPKSNDIDAMPSKLRKLMEFTSPKPNTKDTPHSESNLRSSKGSESNEGKKKGTTGSDKKPNLKDEIDSKPARFSEDGDDENIVTPKQENSGDEGVDKDDKKNKKRKRKPVNDLRFDALEGHSDNWRLCSFRYLEAKKNKHKKGKTEDDMLGFQGHEKIRFGDVVEAPPKLTTVPKASKQPVQAAFQERLRLQAIEAYRDRKKWVSRPGLQIPAAEIANPSV